MVEPRSGRLADDARLGPTHGVQMEDVNIVEEDLPVLTSENNDSISIDKIRSVAKPGRRRATSLRSFEPLESLRVQSMEVLIDSVFGSFSSEDENLLTCQNGSVLVPRGRWYPGVMRSDPFVVIDVQNVQILKVFKTSFLTLEVMPAKEENRPADFGGTVASSLTRRDPFDQWIDPLEIVLLGVPFGLRFWIE